MDWQLLAQALSACTRAARGGDKKGEQQGRVGIRAAAASRGLLHSHAYGMMQAYQLPACSCCDVYPCDGTLCVICVARCGIIIISSTRGQSFIAMAMDITDH